ncbi:MAG: transcription termination/antitermination protein NusA [Bacilli bacterium]|nr:transcription termination/antitermination protein NusA [Bacilli bacterium]
MNGEEFLRALDLISKEKNISKDIIIDGMKQALSTAYRKNNSKTNVRVDFNETTGEFKVMSYLVVVDEYLEPTYEYDDEGKEIEIPPEIPRDAQILLSDAKKEVPDIKVGETIEKEVTPANFGRVAAGAAKQVITQRMREAEKDAVMSEFADKQDEMAVGMLAMEDQRNYYVDLGSARGILPKKDMIPGEEVKMGSSIKVYITKVEAGTKGPLILLSRKHHGFVKRLFESEIPEINDGTIMIAGVAREAGYRSKVAVYSTNDNIDAIGSCIGAKGSRIGNILKELNGEKVDLVAFNSDPVEYIKNALSPAKDVIVSIVDEKEKKALAIVNNDNLSLAIGKKGLNVRLASRLTKYTIDVKTMEQINEEANK